MSQNNQPETIGQPEVPEITHKIMGLVINETLVSPDELFADSPVLTIKQLQVNLENIAREAIREAFRPIAEIVVKEIGEEPQEQEEPQKQAKSRSRKSPEVIHRVEHLGIEDEINAKDIPKIILDEMGVEIAYSTVCRILKNARDRSDDPEPSGELPSHIPPDTQPAEEVEDELIVGQTVVEERPEPQESVDISQPGQTQMFSEGQQNPETNENDEEKPPF